MKKNRIIGDSTYPQLIKLLKVMKITCLLLMIALVQVSASTYSQSTKLTLNLEDVTLSEFSVGRRVGRESKKDSTINGR